MRRGQDTTGIDFTCKKLDGIIDLVETVRSENESLRDIANERYFEIEDLKKEVSVKESEITDLKRQVRDLLRTLDQVNYLD